ncbi:hypothetical protein OG883_44225 [Streptomyces sp. NBC_01142]|uniref:hypothetical protein n=1 Tax=Streptomyces sp. NBC_01142 TaxID=2975865 RepID=UPI002256C665|nr:hypothetical protein [Streptomyces sp. NBC_01142]MCX4826651.1 hypothetical protein [Streptomyces sp. NBC_01142]
MPLTITTPQTAAAPCTCDGTGAGGFFASDDAYIPCEGCGERVQVNCEASCGRCCHACHAEMPC